MSHHKAHVNGFEALYVAWSVAFYVAFYVALKNGTWSVFVLPSHLCRVRENDV